MNGYGGQVVKMYAYGPHLRSDPQVLLVVLSHRVRLLVRYRMLTPMILHPHSPRIRMQLDVCARYYPSQTQLHHAQVITLQTHFRASSVEKPL